MSDRFLRLLDRKACLIADGAMGTNLFAMGLFSGDSPELWNVEHPDRVAAVHRGFVEAGSDIILTNTFGANRHRLKLHDAADRVRELNVVGVRIAGEVAERSGRKIVVAGSMGPTGELFAPLGALTPAEGAATFAEQGEALAAAGADVLWIETMSAKEEVRAAVAGAAETGLPIVCTMTFDTSGCTMMGMTPEEAVEFYHSLEPRPAAFGANCGTGLGDLVIATLGLARAARPADVIVAKSNCGVPEYVDGRIHFPVAPEGMRTYARLVRDAGARIIGGCCGSTAELVRVIVAALDGYEPEVPPDPAAVQARLGLASPAPRGDGKRRARRRDRRRR